MYLYENSQCIRYLLNKFELYLNVCRTPHFSKTEQQMLLIYITNFDAVIVPRTCLQGYFPSALPSIQKKGHMVVHSFLLDTTLSSIMTLDLRIELGFFKHYASL